MIKILQVIPNTDYGGISTMVFHLYRKIDRRKFKITFLSFNKGALHDEIIKQGDEVYYLDWIKKDGIRNHIKNVKRILEKNGPFDIVHSHIGYKSCFVLKEAKKMKIKKRICHIHTSSVEVTWQKLIINILKYLSCKEANILLACNKTSGDFMFKNRKYEILNNAIDLEKYINLDEEESLRIKRELKLKDELIIGHVGRFSDVKNHKYILKIVKFLKDKNLKFKMLLVGDGPLFNEIYELARKQGIEDNILFLGKRQDINYLMNLFDVFILPSKFEGLPLTVVEAQAALTRVIVSSNLSKELDLGLGLVDYVGIEEEDIKIWGDEITKKRELKVNTKDMLKNLCSLGYDSKENIIKLQAIYES